MCGIIGYIGEKRSAPIILSSLKRLEYRGYDSCGVATCASSLYLKKEKGAIEKLEKARSLPGNLGIGHTRWATHGLPCKRNAHPFFDCSKEIAVCHNGIIENFQELREELESRGHKFVSDTDTEVIAHLIEDEILSGKNLFSAVRKALLKIEGSFAVLVISKKENDRLIAARKYSPLVIGKGKNEFFVASDIPAFLPYTKKAVILSDGEIVDIRKEDFQIFDIETGEKIERKELEIEWDFSQAEKQGFPHFMLKEINEQGAGVSETLRGVSFDTELIKNAEKLYITACGTSYHAGLFAKYLLGKLGIPSDVIISSEFPNFKKTLRKKDLVFAISQSGETADLLKSIKGIPCPVMALTNVLGSTITREADSSFYTRCGPEIGVAATKTFTAQIAAILSLYFELRNENINDFRAEIEETVDRLDTECSYIAKELSEKENVYFLGRGINYPIALEGALKFKEITYIHAEGIAAGELKHGTLALIEDGTPVIVVATPDRGNYEKTLGSIMEVKARGAKVYAVIEEGDQKVKKIADRVLELPKVPETYYPVLSVIPLQLIAYKAAVIKGNSPDKPRNLAKSVTVE